MIDQPTAQNALKKKLYSDDRGICRVYEMRIGEGDWELRREGDPFPQRFAATISEDGDTIAGCWEKAEDGANHTTDFYLTTLGFLDVVGGARRVRGPWRPPYGGAVMTAPTWLRRHISGAGPPLLLTGRERQTARRPPRGVTIRPVWCGVPRLRLPAQPSSSTAPPSGSATSGPSRRSAPADLLASAAPASLVLGHAC